MKNIIKLICVIAIISIAFTSCKRCVTCRVDYFTPKATGEKFYQQPEYCGNSADIAREKQNMETAYKIDGNITCEEKK